MDEVVCPAILTGEAREEWDRVAGWLRERGLFDRRRADALLVHCRAWAKFAEAVQTINHEGRLIRLASGRMAPHPAMRIRDQAVDDLLSVVDILGTTPAARARWNRG